MYLTISADRTRYYLREMSAAGQEFFDLGFVFGVRIISSGFSTPNLKDAQAFLDSKETPTRCSCCGIHASH